MLRWPAVAWPRGVCARRGCAFIVATGVLLCPDRLAIRALIAWPRNGVARSALPAARGEGRRTRKRSSSWSTTSSLAALGRWPLSRHLYAKAVQVLDRAGARVIAFDLLFAEPEEPISAELRSAAQTAAAGCPIRRIRACGRRLGASPKTIPTAISPPRCGRAARCCCRLLSPSKARPRQSPRNWRRRSICGSIRACMSRSSRCSRTRR